MSYSSTSSKTSSPSPPKNSFWFPVSFCCCRRSSSSSWSSAAGVLGPWKGCRWTMSCKATFLMTLTQCSAANSSMCSWSSWKPGCVPQCLQTSAKMCPGRHLYCRRRISSIVHRSKSGEAPDCELGKWLHVAEESSSVVVGHHCRITDVSWRVATFLALASLTFPRDALRTGKRAPSRDRPFALSQRASLGSHPPPSPVLPPPGGGGGWRT